MNNKGVNAFNGYEDPSFEKYEDKFKSKSQRVYKNHNTALKCISYCDKDRGDNGLSVIFFSPDNMKRIQKMIKKEVYNRTKGQFRLDADQDEADLLLVMRYTYLEHGRYLSNAIIRQVKILNNQVIQQAVPDIVSNLKQHYAYIKEINSPIKPIDRPICMYKNKTLPSISTVYF
jgi:hypothetical protein